ncbi:X-ray repair cross-complementing protein 6 isoform X2 [Macaca mulatta]|uniref:X-ray repair cross-complementing protein 6 n=1 Tax=Rhinopithecus bieti TaxID=61621 RepID=A0A2K6M876_RHIBE|nr:PREDICTED: X-ray repair cross-complementing protein 6 isoform X2 [Colobus angolensis palliatus]XP_011834155.1 PREDICTED: X-ray repair cross-complementing protein 6 isoform X2 [Mandrillus leucophaeus]XP_025255821.1 X-ray repair cross-complementing protein 6 isoform X3 [Theropithecus gelada]
MSGWESYYKTEGDEEAEEEQEENLEASGDYKYSGRDSLIFLVDASKAMFESQSEDELTPFDMSIQELDNPGAKRILELDQFKGQQGQKRFQDLMGHGSDYSLSEVLWVCANLFSDVQFKMSHKRIMLFTNEDNPHGNDSAKASRARTKAGDLRDTGIFLDLMHLKKPGGFDISLFYRDIISIAEDEDLRVHFEESSKLEDLLRKVRAKETRKRALSRLKLKLNKDIVISVGVYNLVQKALKPPPIKLYRETNEPVKTKTRTFNTSTGGLLLPSDTKRSQIYGSRQIILEKEETEELKRFDDPGLMLMGFKPLVLLKKHHYLRPSLFVYPEESLVIGSSTLFSALLIKCLEKEVAALCRYTPRRNIPPYFVALVPQDEELDDQKIQVTPPGFQLVFLPFADDKRKMPFTEKIMATPEQVDKMKAIVEKLRFTYRSDSFENPVLQQHFRNLEALALDLMEPEQAVDLTLPKVEAMNKRLGSLVDEFKELVYPPDYNPEGKVTKRKHDNDGSGSKRPKVEYSEEELKTHISKGTLGKFTVPMLKEACRAYGLKSGLKKQELLEALTKHFQD